MGAYTMTMERTIKYYVHVFGLSNISFPINKCLNRKKNMATEDDWEKLRHHTIEPL